MSFQTIRRTVIASGIALGAVASAFSPAAFAAMFSSDTQSGSIAATASVSYDAAASATITPNQDQLSTDFGSVTVQSNNNAGWTLEVESASGSFLVHEVNTAAKIRYELKVDGDPVPTITAAATPVVAKTALEGDLSAAGVAGANYLVEGVILGDDSDGKPSGSYSDTLKFTLTND